MALLTHIVRRIPGYLDNPVRQDLWRAGHAHAGVYLLLSLVMLPYVDEAALTPTWKWVARLAAPIAAILIPSAFFLSVVLPGATEPNDLIYLAYPGAAILALGVLALGVVWFGQLAEARRFLIRSEDDAQFWAAGGLSARPPHARVALEVKHAEHDHLFFDEAIEETVRKTTEKGPTVDRDGLLRRPEDWRRQLPALLGPQIGTPGPVPRVAPRTTGMPPPGPQQLRA